MGAAELARARFPTVPQRPADVIPRGEFSAGTRIEAVSSPELPEYRRILLAGIEGMPYSSEKGKREDIEKRTPAYFQEALAHPEEWTLLAAKDTSGAIMGALEARLTEIGGEKRVGFVHWICVDENSRQKGVAADLYREYEQRMRDLGDVPFIMAHVHNDNLPSLALHKKLGITNVFAEREDKRGRWYYKPLIVVK